MNVHNLSPNDTKRPKSAVKITEVKRVYRALQEVGMTISRVIFEGGRLEFIGAGDEQKKTKATTDPKLEEWLAHED